MRIAFVIFGDLGMLSGGYVYDRHLLSHLKRSGDSVRVISLWEGGYPRHLLDNFSSRIAKSLLADDPDLILEDELCHPSLALVNHRIKQYGAPPVISLVHHLMTDEEHSALAHLVYKAAERVYFSGVDGILANTHVTLSRVREVSHREIPAAVAWPGGTLPGPPPSPSEISARLRRRRPLQILFVGNLIERKLVDVLITSVIDLQRRAEVRLTIVGGDEIEPRYARRVRRIARPLVERGLARFVGPKRGVELAPLYSQADVLAVPSSYEGFGIVYLEGMAYGLPAIGTAAGGAREIITDGVNGFLVHPHDTALLTRYLLQLAADRELLRRMSLAARERFDRHPTWTQSMDAARDFLLRMAKR